MGEEDATGNSLFLAGLVIFIGACLYNSYELRNYADDAWMFNALAMSAAFLFALDRWKRNISYGVLKGLSWIAVSGGALIVLFLL